MKERLSKKLQGCRNGLQAGSAEREGTHAALQASEKHYRMLVETMGEGLGMYDENGLVTYANNRLCEIVGLSRGELIGNPVPCLSGEENRGRVEAEIEKRKQGTSSSYEIDYVKKNNERISILVSSSPIFDEHGAFRGGIVTITDISKRKRMEESLRQSERQLKYLSSQLLNAQEKERKRIANEIHDSIGQSLHTLRVGMEHLLHQVTEQEAPPDRASIEEMLRVVDFAVEEVRNIYMDLRPSLLDDLGLLATISWYLREFQTAHPAVRIEEQITLGEDEVPEPIKVILFRILQSTMDNIAQHSNAEKVTLSLKKSGGKMEFAVTDDGMGFDLEDILFGEALGRGLGLPSMQERVESSGGIFSVSSVKGSGSTIKASWNLPVRFKKVQRRGGGDERPTPEATR